MTNPPGDGRWSQQRPDDGDRGVVLAESPRGLLRRNRAAAAVVVVVVLFCLAAVGVETWRAVAPANDLLPGVPAGWTRLTTVDGSQSAQQSVTLHGVQLRICWVARGGGIAELDYEIGSAQSGPAALFAPQAGLSGRRGCVFDSNDISGQETLAVAESGIGSYAVSLDEELSATQESALVHQAEAQAKQAEAQAQQQAKATAESSIDNSAQQLATDLSGVASDTTSVKSDVGRVNNDLEAEKSDLGQTQKQVASVQAEVQQQGTSPTACGDADTAQGDADTVQGDSDTVTGGLDSLKSDATTLQQDLSSFQAADTSYQSLATSVPGYFSADAPTPSGVQQAEANAQTELGLATNTMSSAPTTAQGYVSQANSAAQTAQSVAC